VRPTHRLTIAVSIPIIVTPLAVFSFVWKTLYPYKVDEHLYQRIVRFGKQSGGVGRRRQAAPAVTREDQKLMRRPKRNCRSSGLALVMLMKFPVDWRLPSGLKVIFDAFLFASTGLLKCGVLVRLLASARN
jgi:hypothetical protein